MQIEMIIFWLLIVTTSFFSFLMFVFYFLTKDSVKESFMHSGNVFTKINDSVAETLQVLSTALTPQVGGPMDGVAKYYEKFLMYTNFSIQGFFNLKNALFSITLIFVIAIHITDVNHTRSLIYTKFTYVDNPLFNATEFSDDDKEVILQLKNDMFDRIKEEFGIQTTLNLGKDGAMYTIEQIVKQMNNTKINDTIIAEEVYAKMSDYAKTEKIDVFGMLMKSFLLYLIPDICVAFVNFFNKNSSKAEKRFMKRLIIMNGSIKPTDFMMVLAELIDKSKYYKKVLLEIEDANKKNYQENTKIYSKYIQESKDLETKLFFEKLDEANNYDFDQAILNIKNEFNLDKRMQTRKCKKMVESIHVWGLIGFMVLICMLIAYLLMPWMTAYDMSQVSGIS